MRPPPLTPSTMLPPNPPCAGPPAGLHVNRPVDAVSAEVRRVHAHRPSPETVEQRTGELRYAITAGAALLLQEAAISPAEVARYGYLGDLPPRVGVPLLFITLAPGLVLVATVEEGHTVTPPIPRTH